MRVRIHAIQKTCVLQTDSTNDTINTLTAVIKMNNETSPTNFVLPIQQGEISESSNTPACIFEFDPKRVPQMTFSIIIRDGNIPVHFETVNSNQFIKGLTTSNEGKDIPQKRMLEFSNFQENEVKLQNTKLILYYDLDTS